MWGLWITSISLNTGARIQTDKYIHMPVMDRANDKLTMGHASNGFCSLEIYNTIRSLRCHDGELEIISL